MPALVFRLRNVPDDEADDVRALLEKAGIDHHETTAGNWGIAMPGLWVDDAGDAPRARSLIDAYQRERSVRLRGEWDARRADGDVSLVARLRERPFATVGIVVFCLFVLYVSVNPFLQLVARSS